MFQKIVSKSLVASLCLLASQAQAQEAFNCQSAGGLGLKGLTVDHLPEAGKASVYRILGRAAIAYVGSYTLTKQGADDVYTYELVSQDFAASQAKLVVTVSNHYELPKTCGRGDCPIPVTIESIKAEFDNGVKETYVCN